MSRAGDILSMAEAEWPEFRVRHRTLHGTKEEMHLAASGTSTVADLRASYHDIVRVFGEPSIVEEEGDPGKVSVEWIIEFGDGIIITIHDYRRPRPATRNTNWSVGTDEVKFMDMHIQNYREVVRQLMDMAFSQEGIPGHTFDFMDMMLNVYRGRMSPEDFRRLFGDR